MTERNHLRFFDQAVLLDRLLNSPRELVFLVGSPLTTPEAADLPGVPGVRGVIELVLAELASSAEVASKIASSLAAEGAGAAYRLAFELLLAHRGQDTANRVIRRAVLSARAVAADPQRDTALAIHNYEAACSKLQDDVKGWNIRPSLNALATLLAYYPDRFGSTILTTNFDPLIEVAIRRAGGSCYRTVLHTDGGLSSSQASGCHVVYLHGGWFGSDTLHTPRQLLQPRPQLRRSLERLLARRTLVTLGYGGWDDVLTSCLTDLLADNEAAPDVIWTFYDGDDARISTTQHHLLSTLAPGINRGRVTLFSGIDLHSFLPALLGRTQHVLPGGHDSDTIRFLLERVYELAPELQQKIITKLNPDLITQAATLGAQIDQLSQELAATSASSQNTIQEFERQREALKKELNSARARAEQAQVALALAAMRDVNWLHAIRTQLMPKEPGRAPFHNDEEVAIRGYHCSNYRERTPVLTQVTWSKLPYIENDRHRGYRAGLIFRGHWFAPGVTYASRQVGQTSPPPPRTDYWYRQPNIYWGDYLEVSTHEDEYEAPLGDRDTEYKLRNPNGKESEWVRFSYDFDDGKLLEILNESERKGRELMHAGKYGDAVAPLRKAMVFSRHLPRAKERHPDIERIWNEAIDKDSLSRLRFREGARLRVHKGPHAGKIGTVYQIALRHVHAYFMDIDGSQEKLAASDEQVELVTDDVPA